MNAMIRHILLPTDGSGLSQRAVRNGVRLAKSLGARVTGVHVIPEFHQFTYRSQMLLSYHVGLPEDSEEAYLAATAARAKDVLQFVKKTAAAAGVRCDVLSIRHDQPFRAIIDTATRKRCDLIFMASHGHSGIKGVILGSEAHKVLVHSSLPVLIWR